MAFQGYFPLRDDRDSSAGDLSSAYEGIPD